MNPDAITTFQWGWAARFTTAWAGCAPESRHNHDASQQLPNPVGRSAILDGIRTFPRHSFRRRGPTVLLISSDLRGSRHSWPLESGHDHDMDAAQTLQARP